MTQQTIDGFLVRYVIVNAAEKRFQVAITTSQSGAAQARQWEIPGSRCFDTQEEASRYGRYVLLGISSLTDDGKPLFTVV